MKIDNVHYKDGLLYFPGVSLVLSPYQVWKKVLEIGRNYSVRKKENPLQIVCS